MVASRSYGKPILEDPTRRCVRVRVRAACLCLLLREQQCRLCNEGQATCPNLSPWGLVAALPSVGLGGQHTSLGDGLLSPGRRLILALPVVVVEAGSGEAGKGRGHPDLKHGPSYDSLAEGGWPSKAYPPLRTVT